MNDLYSTVPASARGRAPVELNLLCISGVIVLALADVAALCGHVDLAAIGAVSTPVFTGLFALVNRSPAP
ncbi:MAG: hypothetical protein JO303_13725 [Caulobacteraceae bacterium]|nr:hypothetical protein [Caulobacteraceae bacterium]